MAQVMGEALDPKWVELQAADGRTYFWHRGDSSTKWSMPEGTKALWVSQKTPDGRMYYWSRETKEVTWNLPKLETTAAKDSAIEGNAASELQKTLLTSLQETIGRGDTSVVKEEEPEGSDTESSHSGRGNEAAAESKDAAKAEEVKTEERANSSSEDEDDEKEEEAKDEVKHEVKDEVKDEVDEDTKEDTKEEAKEETKEETKEEAKDEGNEEVKEAQEEEEEEEEEDPPTDSPDPGAPGPLGESASAVAARHLMATSVCDSWFHQVASHAAAKGGSGGWEEVLKFWPPKRRKKLNAPPPATGEGNDPFGLKPLVRRCRLHENRVRALLAAADGSDIDYSAERYPAPEVGDCCYWSLNGSQLTVHEDGTGANIKRNPPDGARWRLMKNSLRSRLSIVFQANKLRDLEAMMRKRNGKKIQKFLDKLEDIPEALLKSAQVIAGPKETPQSFERKAEAAGTKGKAGSISLVAESTKIAPAVESKSAPKMREAKKEPVSQKAQTTKEDPKKEKKTVSSEPVAFAPKRTEQSDESAPWAKRRRQKKVEKDVPLDPVEVRKERLQRIIVVDNVPSRSSTSEMADFFTGAVFSGAGHPIAAQWQTGTASKVVLAVDINGSRAEVTFGTHLAATVALSLNGIMLKQKPLTMRRPEGYEGKGNLPQPIALKDLVASEAVERTEARLAAEKASGNEDLKGKTVLIKGVPPSMSESSVRDLLFQFGGALSSLFLQKNQKTTLHTGAGVAEFETHESALEAVRFSPLLGFIEVRLEKAGEIRPDPFAPSAPTSLQQAFPEASAKPAGAAAAAAAASKSKLRGWEDDEEDLGPFEAVLQNRVPVPAQKSVPAPAPSKTSDDLGPFEAVLAAQKKTPAKIALEKAQAARRFREAEKKSAQEDDLGPFEAVLAGASASVKQPKAPGEEDLGPFESVLPMAPARGFVPKRKGDQVLLPMAPVKVQKKDDASKTRPDEEDLGPFESVFSRSNESTKKSTAADEDDFDLGPFAEALAGLPKKS